MGDGHAPLLGEPLENDRQQVAIGLRGRLALLGQLVEGVRLEDFVAAERAGGSRSVSGRSASTMPLSQSINVP